MARLTSSVPTMFADHHVLKVKEALAALDGVQEVVASSAWQAVIVSYDESKVGPEEIEATLGRAGYEPGKKPPILAANLDHYRDPAWEVSGARVTNTNQADLAV